MEDISRFKLHKKLGTWHFNPNRKESDYAIVDHIDKPEDFWNRGMDEVLNKEASILTNGFWTKDEVIVDSATKSAIKSLQNDVISMQAPKDDCWFERRSITKDMIFGELYDYFWYLDHVDMRVATQKPMDMTYRHIDHEHQQILSSGEGEDEQDDVENIFKSRGKWRKYIVLIHDLKPGQVFYWGNSVVEAVRGDVFSWDYACPHWAANFSDETRHSFMITGKEK